MPSRNRVKLYLADTYYHAYNRGVNKEEIFRDKDDYAVFMNLLKRYLSKEEAKDRYGRLYQKLSDEVELLAFCLMPNHFHLFLYQYNKEGMTKLIRRVMSSYARYFNDKYGRIGVLFQDRFKAADIDNERYLWHISRYIHLNPLDLGKPPDYYEYSSYPYYTGEKHADWVKPDKILELHSEYGGQSYVEFVNDYTGYKQSLVNLKYELAD